MQTPFTTARLKAVDPIIIKCGKVDGPSRFDRMAARRLAPRNLGAFEGERLSSCHGYDESYGVMKAALSLIAVVAFLFIVAMMTGAA